MNASVVVSFLEIVSENTLSWSASRDGHPLSSKTHAPLGSTSVESPHAAEATPNKARERERGSERALLPFLSSRAF